jgi:RNA polymerase sigma factor (sigma-70 family)
MKLSKQAEIFEQARASYTRFLASVLWKLTAERELFTEAMQYALLGIWQHVGKLNNKKAQSYIYRIALSAASKAWRNRIGKDREVALSQIGIDKGPDENADRSELVSKVRQAITQLPTKQGRAIVMRYLEQQNYKSIAEKLCCTEAGARSHVSKAVATLKSKLATLTEQE